MLVIENFIDGELIASADGKRFETRSPVNNNVVASVTEAGRADVDAAVAAARQALNGEWGALSLERRVALIYALADEIERRLGDFVEAETTDTGQPRHVLNHVIGRSVANFRVFADTIKGVSDECY